LLNRIAAAVALIVLLLAGLPYRADAQLTLPTAGPAAAPNGIRQEGAFLTAPIRIDGRELFRIATPIGPSTVHISIGQRQGYVQAAIAQLLATRGNGFGSKTDYDPATLRVGVAGGGDVAVLQAVDDKHRDPLAIVTVTSVDARFNQDSIDGVAAQWQSVLQNSLVAALDLRQPVERAENLRRVGQVALALMLLTALMGFVLAALGRRIRGLTVEVEAKNDAVDAQVIEGAQNQETDAHKTRPNVLALSLEAIAPAQQLALYRATSATLFALTNLLWFVAATWAFSLFPVTASLGQTLTNDLLAVTVTIFAAIFLDRVLDLVIARVTRFWGTGTLGRTEDRARQVLRIPTISSAIRATKSLLLVFVAGLTILTQIGVPVGSVVTIGGLIALALSLAAQSFVRDFVNGALVLVEDQYVIGDYISVTPGSGTITYSGTVERLTLRMAQLRDRKGSLITIPHGVAATVVNRSRNWSRVDYRVPVDPATDIPKAIALVKSAIEELAGEADWTGALYLPIDIAGIDDLSRDGVIIRASVKTAPLRQFEIRRQINARVQQSFAAAGIAFGAPVSDDLPT
jgi:small conductance mechanosensitive channel